MKKFIMRAAALLAAAAVYVTASVSCSEKKEHSHEDHNIAGGELPDDLNVKEEDMPYGAEYKQLTPDDADIPIGVEYDPRYVSQEEAEKLVAYFYSLSSRDPKYLEKSVHPDMMKYRLDNSGYSSAQEFLDSEYELIKQYTQSDFDFTFVLVDGMMKKEELDSNLAAYDRLVAETVPNGKITDRKAFMVNCTYSKPTDTDGSVYSLQLRLGDYVTVCVYTIDGEPYIVS